LTALSTMSLVRYIAAPYHRVAILRESCGGEAH
jgi:hypothetical protein